MPRISGLVLANKRRPHEGAPVGRRRAVAPDGVPVPLPVGAVQIRPDDVDLGLVEVARGVLDADAVVEAGKGEGVAGADAGPRVVRVQGRAGRVVDVEDALHLGQVRGVAFEDALAGLGAHADADGVGAVLVVVKRAVDCVAKGFGDESEQECCENGNRSHLMLHGGLRFWRIF